MKLQNLIIRVISGIAISLSFTTTGCNKDEDVVPVIRNTVAGLILKGANFSTLEALVGKANLAIILEGTGPFTVFAPDDSAFAASGITPAFINSLSQAQAQTILLYHTLNSKVMAADLPIGPNDKVITFSGDSIFVTKNANGILVNGIKLTEADIVADNGIIHKIDRVLNPPLSNIAETAIANGLDSLAKALTRATNDTTGDADLTNTLNTATFTLFAPTDSAFIELLTALTLTDINDIPVDTLVNVLSYHIVPGRVFSSDLADGSLTMFAGGNSTINLTNGAGGGPTITGTNNGGNASNIIAANILFRNGIVHQIDRVLIP